MGMDEDASEQLRKSCDYCARMKRACDGQVPCSLCCRRGKTCARSIRRKSGPAKGAKYAPRRSKVEKETAAAAITAAAGATSGVKAKIRSLGPKKRDVGDTRVKAREDENGKTAPRRLKYAKAVPEVDENRNRVPPTPPGSPLVPGSSAMSSAAVKQTYGTAEDGESRGGAGEVRAGSSSRNDTKERDAYPRQKGAQRSMKKRKPGEDKVAAQSPSIPAPPCKKRVPSSESSAVEDGWRNATPEDDRERRAGSDRPESGNVSSTANPSAPIQRPCAFPGEGSDSDGRGRPGEARTGHCEYHVSTTADDLGSQSRRRRQHQQQQQPWQGAPLANAPSVDSPVEHEGSTKPVVHESEKISPGGSGTEPVAEAAPPSENGNGSWSGRGPATVSPMREDEAPTGWEEPPSRVQAWEPSIKRGGIDAYYRQHAGMGVQLGRVRLTQTQQEQTVPLAPKELLLMLRPNDKDIIDVIVDDKRGAVRREGGTPALAVTPREKAFATAIPVPIPRTTVRRSSNGGDSHARTQARELLARIRRDAAAQAKANSYDDELAPKNAAVLSPAARLTSPGGGGVISGNGAPPDTRDIGELAREIRRPGGEGVISLGRPQGWGARDEFGRTSLPPLQHGRGAYEVRYGWDRDNVGSEYSMSRLKQEGVRGRNIGNGGARYTDFLRVAAGPVFGPRDLVDGCLGPNKTHKGSRGGSDGDGGEGGRRRASPSPDGINVPVGRTHVDYHGARTGNVPPIFREDERKAAVSRPGREGPWGYSLLPHSGLRDWPSVPMAGPQHVVNHGPVQSPEPHNSRYFQEGFYPAGDHRLSAYGRSPSAGGLWKGNTWSLGTLAERRSGNDFRHPPHQEHPEYTHKHAGDRYGPAEAVPNQRSWPQRAQPGEWSGDIPARVSPNAGSDTP